MAILKYATAMIFYEYVNNKAHIFEASSVPANLLQVLH